jgi:hypothetical protein
MGFYLGFGQVNIAPAKAVFAVQILFAFTTTGGAFFLGLAHIALRTSRLMGLRSGLVAVTVTTLASITTFPAKNKCGLFTPTVATFVG